MKASKENSAFEWPWPEINPFSYTPILAKDVNADLFKPFNKELVRLNAKIAELKYDLERARNDRD